MDLAELRLIANPIHLSEVKVEKLSPDVDYLDKLKQAISIKHPTIYLSEFNLSCIDKNIDAYIVYGEHKWNLELSSGMERFVSSLAIRIGLINVSTLPRPNFIIVDEGFGSLDSDNIANMQGAFQYLRTQFDFTMVITHLDTIKDYMDILIPIEVNNGLSKVIY